MPYSPPSCSFFPPENYRGRRRGHPFPLCVCRITCSGRPLKASRHRRTRIHSLLFTPLEIRSVTLKNRVVVAPMHQYSADRGQTTDWHLMNAGRYAAGGAGLVMMESTKVARNGCGTVGDTALWDDSFIPGFARCATFIKQQGAVAAIQLGHSGRKARLSRPWEGQALKATRPGYLLGLVGLLAPSAIAHDIIHRAERALQNEVRTLSASGGESAERSDKAGFAS